MLRRLIAGMILALLLFSAAAAERPEASGLSGTWQITYLITGGQAQPGSASGEVYQFADGNVFFPGSSAANPLVYEDGSYSTADPEGRETVFSLVGEGVMTASRGSETLLLNRLPDAPAENPFLGDWQVLMLSIDGVQRVADAENHFFDLRFGPYSVGTLVDGVVFSAQPCYYMEGRCILTGGSSQVECTIDRSGVMSMKYGDTGVICFLVPAAAER